MFLATPHLGVVRQEGNAHRIEKWSYPTSPRIRNRIDQEFT